MNAFAGPSKTTYQAKIVKPDGYPLESSSVNFKFSILEPAGSCVLYSETYSSVNMNTTGGLISFSLGSGLKTFPASSTTFENVFSNITPNMACDAGGGAPSVYTPGPTDARKIIMQFNDGSGWQTLPAMNINAVPYAMYANDAMKFNGLAPSDFVQMTMMPTCTASEALRYNGASFNCVTVGSNVSVTSGSVITALGYTPANGVSVTTLTSSLASANASIATVSSTVYSVSSTVASLANTVSNLSTTVSDLSASMAAITTSQWLTSGTSISYSAGNVGIGTSAPATAFQVVGTTTFGDPSVVNPYFQFYDSTGAIMQWTSTSKLLRLRTRVASSSIVFDINASEKMRLHQNGYLGIGTISPVVALDVSGGIRVGIEASTCSASLAGTLRYNAGVVEYCNGTTWSAFGVAGAGITSLNGSTSGTQTFTTGTAGTAFNINSVNGVHTFNIPLASAASVTGGLLSNADYTTFMNKVTSSAASVAQVLGYTAANQTAMATSFAAVTTTTNALAASITANTATITTNSSSITALTSSMTANSASINGLTTSATNLTSLVNNHTTSLTNLAASMAAVTTSGWGTSGNAGTSATVNYIGTSDGVDVVFRRANTRSGLIGSANTSFGYRAFSATSATGSYNSAFGLDALANNSIGYQNTAMGASALQSNTFGASNSGFGNYALRLNTTGMYNTGIGESALSSNTLGSFNSGVGTNALVFNTFGSYNTAVGNDALYNNSSGSHNTAIGYQAGASHTLTSNSVFIGDNATTTNNGLNNVIAIGYQAQATQSNLVVLGNSSITRTILRGAVETYVTDVSSGLTVVNNTSTSARYPIITVSNYASGTTGHPVLSMANSGGEASAPTAIAGGMNLGTLLWTGQVTASQTMQGARIDATAEANFSTNMAPTRLVFSTAPGSGTYQQRMVINSQGFVGIGVTSPNATVHIGASTSSSAALKLVSGTLLAAPASGAIEYDGFNFYVTDSSNIRRTIATGSSSGAIDTNTVTNATGNINFVPNGSVIVSATTTSTNSQTGALVVKGGLGLAGDFNTASNLNVSGSSIIDGSLRVSSLTSGSVLFAGANGVVSQDNSKFYWDDTNNRLGIGTASPNVSLNVSGTGIIVDNGTTASYGSGIKFMNTTYKHYTAGVRGTDFVIADTSTNGTQTWAAAPVDRLVISSAGNMGVGTSSPSARLEVTSPNDTSTALYVGNSTSGGVTGLYFSRWGGVSSPMGIQGTISGSGANAITLQAQAGNVGVGTINPTEKLTVYDGNVHIPYVANKTHGYKLDIGNNLVYLWRNYQYADDSFFISQNWYANDAGTDIIPNAAHTTQAIEMRRHVGIMLKTGPVNTVPSARLTVDPNGLIGIGTTTPGSRLHIVTPVSASVNNRLVTGNSNSDLVNATGLTGEILLDHAVGARFYATTATSLTRVATFKIDNAPTLSGTITADEALALYVQSGNSAFGGALGVGTSNLMPNTKLHVYRGAASASTYVATNSTALIEDDDYALLDLAVKNNGLAGVRFNAQSDTTGAVFYYGSANPSGERMALLTSGTEKVTILPSGYVGIGVSNPASRLSNISITAVNANIGNEGGTGQNASSMNWGTSAAGYSAAISNNSSAGGANGLQVRTLGTTSSNIVFTAGIGVSSTANTKDILTVRSDSRVGINTTTPLQSLTVNGMMALQTTAANDHVYMEFYARSATPTTRSGWFGYPGAASTVLTATNEISGGHMNLQTTGTGKVGINQSAPSYMLDVNGTLRGYGITDSSDIRLKKYIQPLDLSLEKILSVQGVSYYWKDKKVSEKKQIGFIAQQLEKIFPELVETDNQGMKSVNYSHLVSPLVEAVKSLYTKITRVEAQQDAQAREIATVKQENAEIRAENQKLKDRLDRLEKMMSEKK